MENLRSVPGVCDRAFEYPIAVSARSAITQGLRFQATKRLLDICLSLSLLIVFMPLIVMIAVLIWMQGDGPVFYVSRRIGKNGNAFNMYKFRTMVANADQLQSSLRAHNERDGVLFKITNDPRITRIGRVLRRHSLDEIPQLINVLRGELSLVGPRPPLASEVEQYSSHHLFRLEVLPGVTGLWQISARRSPSFDDYIAFDSAYVRNQSLWLDVKILWRTIGVVLAGTGE